MNCVGSRHMQFEMQLFNFNDVFFHRQLGSLLDMCVCMCVCMCEGGVLGRPIGHIHQWLMVQSRLFHLGHKSKWKPCRAIYPLPSCSQVKGVARTVCPLQMQAMVKMNEENLELIIQYKLLLEGNVEEQKNWNAKDQFVISLFALAAKRVPSLHWNGNQIKEIKEKSLSDYMCSDFIS